MRGQRKIRGWVRRDGGEQTDALNHVRLAGMSESVAVDVAQAADSEQDRSFSATVTWSGNRNRYRSLSL